MKNIEIIPTSLIKFRWHIAKISHQKFKGKIRIKDYDRFLKERVLRDVSSFLIQQKELKKARSLLKTRLKNPRHIFYYSLTFLPSWIIDIYIWQIRYYVKLILGLIFPYYKISMR